MHVLSVCTQSLSNNLHWQDATLTEAKSKLNNSEGEKAGRIFRWGQRLELQACQSCQQLGASFWRKRMTEMAVEPVTRGRGRWSGHGQQPHCRLRTHTLMTQAHSSFSTPHLTSPRPHVWHNMLAHRIKLLGALLLLVLVRVILQLWEWRQHQKFGLHWRGIVVTSYPGNPG